MFIISYRACVESRAYRLRRASGGALQTKVVTVVVTTLGTTIRRRPSRRRRGRRAQPSRRRRRVPRLRVRSTGGLRIGTYSPPFK